MSREGRASKIFYSWGISQEQELQELIEWEGNHEAIAVHIDKLLAALKTGVERFLKDMPNTTLVLSRAKILFTNMPPLKKAW